MLLLILITCSKKRNIVQLSSLLLGQTIGSSRTRDKGKKFETVPEIPGQLEPMTYVQLHVHVLTLCLCIHTYMYKCMYNMIEKLKCIHVGVGVV